MFLRACLCAAVAWTARASETAPETDAPRLAEAERAGAFFSESLSIPSAGELFAACGKHGRHDWAALFRKPAQGPFFSRPQIALGMGVLIAEGFLASQAQDRQQVKNVLREIKVLTKSLGLEQEFMGRMNCIEDFADKRQWDALEHELEAVQNELAASMAGLGDAELVSFVNLGCWLRALNVVSTQVGAAYSPDCARILRQPAVGAHFLARLEALPAKHKAAPLVVELQRALPAMGAALSFPVQNPPAAEAVKQLSALTDGLLAKIAEPTK